MDLAIGSQGFVKPACGEPDIVVTTTVCACVRCALIHPDLSRP